MSKVNIADFTNKLYELNRAYSKLPNEIAATAVNFSKERFRDQAWLDKTKETWKPRARSRQGGSKRSQTLLVNTGRLKRGIRKVRADENLIIIGNDVPYAQVHNDGGIITGSVMVKQHTKKEYDRYRKGRKEIVKSHKVSSHIRKLHIKIPARKFIGNSYTLERRIYLLITARFIKALKQ